MTLLPFARLLRIPNVFTALADILMAGLVGGTLLDQPLRSLALLAASACLYLAGMVWNDVYDLDEDRRDRPFRPLPSGQISESTARAIGVGLLVLGIAFAAMAGWDGSRYHISPVGTAIFLVFAILAYDGGLKQTPIGPASMGLCRFLNVLLGLSLVPDTGIGPYVQMHLALVIGVYIAGVTWFARAEAGTSSPRRLKSAAGVIGLAMLLALALPTHFPAGTTSAWFPYLLVGFVVVIAGPIRRAIFDPRSAQVQTAVKTCILGLIGLDAVLAVMLVGPSGLLLLLLLPPALIVGKWVYST